MQLLRGGAQAKLPSKGGHLHELKEEGPPRGHLPQRKAFKRERTGCFCISDKTI
jgi:hypothetical protein